LTETLHRSEYDLTHSPSGGVEAIAAFGFRARCFVIDDRLEFVVDAVNTPLIESKGSVQGEGFRARTDKQVGPSPDWKSGNGNSFCPRVAAGTAGIVLGFVLERLYF
jgi:hypothetical protein